MDAGRGPFRGLGEGGGGGAGSKWGRSPSVVRGQRPSEAQAEKGDNRLPTRDVGNQGAFVGPAPGGGAVGEVVIIVVDEREGREEVGGLGEDGMGAWDRGAGPGDEKDGEVRGEEGLCGVVGRRSMLVWPMAHTLLGMRGEELLGKRKGER